MNKLIIEFIDGKKEEFNRSQVTPTGVEMRNTSASQLRKVLHGDGRRLLVYEKDGTRIIMPNEIRNILIKGKSVFIEENDRREYGVWSDEY